jgi:UDP-N-acetylmuramyl pentapeptide phosphotransferase/UDP-N-acetylglucosamine-1-phosphate transferase
VRLGPGGARGTGGDRWHTRPTPVLGGVGIFAGLAVAYGALVAGGTLD